MFPTEGTLFCISLAKSCSKFADNSWGPPQVSTLPVSPYTDFKVKRFSAFKFAKIRLLALPYLLVCLNVRSGKPFILFFCNLMYLILAKTCQILKILAKFE